jgi:hypothetical protein
MARNQSHDVMYDDYDERYMYGWIDSTDGDTVMARLEDNHGGAYQARIPKTAFPRSDRGRLTPGACFHWSRTLSTSDTPSGQSEFVLEETELFSDLEIIAAIRAASDRRRHRKADGG